MMLFFMGGKCYRYQFLSMDLDYSRNVPPRVCAVYFKDFQLIASIKENDGEMHYKRYLYRGEKVC